MGRLAPDWDAAAPDGGKRHALLDGLRVRTRVGIVATSAITIVGAMAVGPRWGQLAMQVVHGVGFPFRLPIPSDVPVGRASIARSGAGGKSARKSAVGIANRVPVTAVEKSRIRS